jgi:hypothetical protein
VATAATLACGAWVVVVIGVRDEQHGGVGAAVLHMLPRQATLGAAAAVVVPKRTYKINSRRHRKS